MSAGAVATSFLAGYALPRRSGVAVVAALVVAALFVGVVVLTLLTLIPQTWTFRNDPQAFLADWVDSKTTLWTRCIRSWPPGWEALRRERGHPYVFAAALSLCHRLRIEIVVLLALALTKGNAA